MMSWAVYQVLPAFPEMPNLPAVSGLPVVLLMYVVALHVWLVTVVAKEAILTAGAAHEHEQDAVYDGGSAGGSAGSKFWARVNAQMPRGAPTPKQRRRSPQQRPTQVKHAPETPAEALRAQLHRIALRRAALETRLRRHEEELHHRMREDLLYLERCAGGAGGAEDSAASVYHECELEHVEYIE